LQPCQLDLVDISSPSTSPEDGTITVLVGWKSSNRAVFARNIKSRACRSRPLGSCTVSLWIGVCVCSSGGESAVFTVYVVHRVSLRIAKDWSGEDPSLQSRCPGQMLVGMTTNRLIIHGAYNTTFPFAHLPCTCVHRLPTVAGSLSRRLVAALEGSSLFFSWPSLPFNSDLGCTLQGLESSGVC
jgi:hypothetical protein